MPRQMNLDSFAVLITKVMESLSGEDQENPGLKRALVEMSKLGITTVPHEIGLLHARTESSRIAAEAIQKSRGRLCQELYEFLTDSGQEGATDAEMQAGTGMYYKTQMPRRIELQAGGLVVQSGEKRLNPTRRNNKDPSKLVTGLPAMVWVTIDNYDPLGYHSQEAIDERMPVISETQKKTAAKMRKLLKKKMIGAK